MSAYETRRLLVVVKTYPTPSQKYGETVCCAGVDLATGRWVRMYPITFRRLADRRFAKYQVINCRATRPRDDNRPESLRIDQDSIQLVGRVMPAGKAGWTRRMALLPPVARSLEEVRERQATDGTSIAMVRPLRVDRPCHREGEALDRTAARRPQARAARPGTGADQGASGAGADPVGLQLPVHL